VTTIAIGLASTESITSAPRVAINPLVANQGPGRQVGSEGLALPKELRVVLRKLLMRSAGGLGSGILGRCTLSPFTPAQIID
jgi:hypothetical protein